MGFGGKLSGVVIVVWVFKTNVTKTSPLESDETLSNTELRKIGQSAIVVYYPSFQTM